MDVLECAGDQLLYHQTLRGGKLDAGTGENSVVRCGDETPCPVIHGISFYNDSPEAHGPGPLKEQSESGGNKG